MMKPPKRVSEPTVLGPLTGTTAYILCTSNNTASTKGSLQTTTLFKLLKIFAVKETPLP